jgi:hypothetical protein
MAVQTIYLLGTTGVTPNFWGNTQLNGSAPAVATTAFGWVPSRTAITTPYYRGRLGATAGATAAQAASYNTAATGPAPGTGSGITTAGDSFIAGPFYGTFANTNWTFNCNLRATTAGCVGHINMRMWRGTNATGAGATAATGNLTGATVTLSTTADTNSSVTSWSPGAMTLVNEYLFFQIEWQETTVGGTNNDNVFFRTNTSSITTADFIAAAVGTLALTQQAQGIAATGSVPVVGALAITETPDPLVGAGTVSGGLPPITGAVGGAPDTNTVLLVHADGTNGSTSFTDASSYAHTLTAVSTAQVTTSSSKFGTGSAKFDGDTASYIDTGNATDFNFGSGQFTVELWAYYTSATATGGSGQYRSAVSKWGPEGIDSWWFGNGNASDLGFLWSTSGVYDGTKWLSGSFVPTLNTWYHIAVDRDASNLIRIYVNGAVIASQTVTDFLYASTQTCAIGDDKGGNPDGFPGYLDEVRVSNVARYAGAFTPPIAPFTVSGPLAQAAQTLSAAGTVLSGITGGLGPSVPAYTVLLLHFDGPNNSTTFTDDSFSAHPLTSVAGAFNSAGTTMFGSPGALFLPGGASSVSAGVSEDFHFGAGPFTIEAWCMFFSNAVDIIATQGDLDNPAGDLGWSFFTNSGNLGFAFTTNGTNFGAAYAAFTPTLYTWYHLAVDRDATNTLRIYINGVVGTSSPSFTYTIYPSARNTLIGNDAISSNYVFNGYLDEIRITKGFAQYGGAFTPPAQAFLPDFPISGLTQANQTLQAAGTVGSPAITGTLAITEAPDGLTATGRVVVGGTLVQPQAPQTIVGNAGVTVGAALSVTEAPDPLTGTARVVVGGTLTVSESPDALAGQASVGFPLITAALSLTQASQGVVAAGGPVAGAALAQPQAAQTIVGHAGSTVTGTLTQPQAPQTLIGAGGATVSGTLTQPQAPQTIVAAGGPRVGGTLSISETTDGLAATATVTVRGTLAAPQAAQTLLAAGSVLSGVGGGLAQTQDPQTLQGAAYATPVCVGALNLTQAPQALVAGGGSVVAGHLTASQDAQTLTGHAGPVAGATLTATQAPQTLAGVANGAAMGRLVATQVDQSFTGRATLTVGAVLALLQDSEIITARGHSDIAAALHLTQAAQRLSASGTTGYVQTRALLMA